MILPIKLFIVPTTSGYVFKSDDERINLTLNRPLTEFEMYMYAIDIKDWFAERGYQTDFCMRGTEQ